MMLDPDFRPYAATANVLALIERTRTRNLPESIKNDFLALTGIPEVVFGRVRQALEFLDLVYEDGRPTPKLQSLAKATDSEFPDLLAACLREAYREDFQRGVDPSQDSQGKIEDAFRRYQPRSQTNRMVMLFLGLCRAAGMPVLDAPRERKMADRGQRRITQRPAQTRKQPPSRQGWFDQLFQQQPILQPQREQSAAFSISDHDIAALDDADFEELWIALGKVTRARARRVTEEAQSKVEREADQTKDS